MFLLLFTSSSKRPQEKDSAPSPSITLQRTPKPSHKRTLSQSSTSVPSSGSSKDSSKSSSKRRKGEDKPVRRDAKVCLFTHRFYLNFLWVSVLYLQKVHTLLCSILTVFTVYTSCVNLYTWNNRDVVWLPSWLFLIYGSLQSCAKKSFKFYNFMTIRRNILIKKKITRLLVLYCLKCEHANFLMTHHSFFYLFFSQSSSFFRRKILKWKILSQHQPSPTDQSLDPNSCLRTGTEALTFTLNSLRLFYKVFVLNSCSVTWHFIWCSVTSKSYWCILTSGFF